MAIKDLLPWNRSSDKVEIVPERDGTNNELDFFEPLWDRWMNDDWLSPFRMNMVDSGFGEDRFSPQFDIRESDKEITVSVDAPGMKAEDFTVSFESNHLIISGERKMEKKDAGESYSHIGRFYGSFRQQIPIPEGLVNESKIKANYKSGVLKIILPKEENIIEKSRKIPIKSA